MKEYFVEKPMPQFGKDIYSCIPIPNEIVAEIKADAIDEYRELLKNYFVIPHDLRVIDMYAEQLKEMNNE